MDVGNDGLISLKDEIADLESRLNKARTNLIAASNKPDSSPSGTQASTIHGTQVSTPHQVQTESKTHFLLLLSDSALPLGSFAFSSGLESYIAHQHGQRTPPRRSVERFLRLSIHSLSASTLPFVIAAYKTPIDSPILDDIFDASTTCSVARRASISQGRALLSVFEKSFSTSLPTSPPDMEAFETYRQSLRSKISEERANGHFGVSWGLVCKVCGLDLESTCYLFLFNHAKATLSAAVRQSLIGPYQGQALLATESTRMYVRDGLDLGGRTSIDKAGQMVPTFDIYQGRHELLYSRVFNS
ncbi:hypothetical protein P167DRAFT_532478 [Morchella conica CCBAS932]|uniref:Urease accessory protein UreF n=1 Tax=Morchella conica CCBAS932 TaxID=1392247 RepID=A0A3N4L3D8_9PEZI|nr:hypothetical protein P167DRAFT_532478 [Morchella conica CCBAS932]